MASGCDGGGELLLKGEPRSLAELNAMLSAAPPLCEGAPCAVLGEGPIGAALAFVGEQPGDQEETQGRPFVGPAGQLLTRAMAEAGIDREKCYLTNAVKYFKFERRGGRRIHEKPTAGEVRRYRFALDKELDFVAPGLVVALGATAVLALAGKPLSVLRSRGPAALRGRAGFISVHPPFLLRLPDAESRRRGYADFLADLREIGRLARAPSAPAVRGRRQAVETALPGAKS